MYQKPSVEELEPLVAEALDGRTEQDWINDYLGAVGALVKNDPARYRAYGVYWALLKRQLLNKGVLDFGTEVDDTWLNQFSYERLGLEVAAAYVYSKNQWDMGKQYSNTHYLIDDESGVHPVGIADDEMEMLIQSKGLM